MAAEFIDASSDNDLRTMKRMYYSNRQIINLKRRLGGQTAILRAAANGHREVIEFLLEKRANVNLRDSNNWTALMFACANGHFFIAKQLLAAGADATLVNEERKSCMDLIDNTQARVEIEELVHVFASPVVRACMQGDPGQLVDFLDTQLAWEAENLSDDSNVDINVVYPIRKETMLHMACYRGHVDVACCLLERGADINLADAVGNTPIQAAIEAGAADIAVKLLELGNGRNVTSTDGKSLFDVAFESRRIDFIARALLCDLPFDRMPPHLPVPHCDSWSRVMTISTATADAVSLATATDATVPTANTATAAIASATTATTATAATAAIYVASASVGGGDRSVRTVANMAIVSGGASTRQATDLRDPLRSSLTTKSIGIQVLHQQEQKQQQQQQQQQDLLEKENLLRRDIAASLIQSCSPSLIRKLSFMRVPATGRRLIESTDPLTAAVFRQQIFLFSRYEPIGLPLHQSVSSVVWLCDDYGDGTEECYRKIFQDGRAAFEASAAAAAASLPAVVDSKPGTAATSVLAIPTANYLVKPDHDTEAGYGELGPHDPPHMTSAVVISCRVEGTYKSDTSESFSYISRTDADDSFIDVGDAVGLNISIESSDNGNTPSHLLTEMEAEEAAEIPTVVIGSSRPTTACSSISPSPTNPTHPTRPTHSPASFCWVGEEGMTSWDETAFVQECMTHCRPLRRVALKFTADQDLAQREIEVRENCRLSSAFVMCILDSPATVTVAPQGGGGSRDTVDSYTKSNEALCQLHSTAGCSTLLEPTTAAAAVAAAMQYDFPYAIVLPAAVCNLAEYVRRMRPTVHQVATLMSGVVRAVQHMHSRNTIHGNLCASNVLLLSDSSVRLLDMKAAALAEVEAVGRNCSTGTMCPELFKKLSDVDEAAVVAYWQRGSDEVGSNSPVLWDKFRPVRIPFRDRGWVDAATGSCGASSCSYCVKAFDLIDFSESAFLTSSSLSCDSEEGFPSMVYPRDPRLLPYSLLIADATQDIWALGALLFELCSGSSLLPLDRDGQLYPGGMAVAAHWTDRQLYSIIRERVSDPVAVSLLSLLLRVSPSDRLGSIAAVLAHPFLSTSHTHSEVWGGVAGAGAGAGGGKLQTWRDAVAVDRQEELRLQKLDESLQWDQWAAERDSAIESRTLRLRYMTELRARQQRLTGDLHINSIIESTVSCKIPTRFVVLPYDCRHATVHLEQRTADAVADVDFTNTAIDLAILWLESMAAVGDALTSGSASRLSQTVADLAEGRSLWLYPVDEVSMLPIIASRGDYPLELQLPQQLLPKLLPLFRLTLKSIGVLHGLAGLIQGMFPMLPLVPDSFVRAIRSFVGALDPTGLQQEFELLDSLFSPASSPPSTAKLSTTSAAMLLPSFISSPSSSLPASSSSSSLRTKEGGGKSSSTDTSLAYEYKSYIDEGPHLDLPHSRAHRVCVESLTELEHVYASCDTTTSFCGMVRVLLPGGAALWTTERQWVVLIREEAHIKSTPRVPPDFVAASLSGNSQLLVGSADTDGEVCEDIQSMEANLCLDTGVGGEVTLVEDSPAIPLHPSLRSSSSFASNAALLKTLAALSREVSDVKEGVIELREGLGEIVEGMNMADGRGVGCGDVNGNEGGDNSCKIS